MYESFHERHTEEEISGAVTRFRDDLNLRGESYIDAHTAVGRWLTADFDMDERAVDGYITKLEEARILPTADTYERSPELALEQHRLAMYAYWMPLYRETHNSHEFSLWLPTAFHIILPKNGPHNAQNCHAGEVTEETSVSELISSCPVSTACPLKVIATDLRCSVPFLPLTPEEQAVTDLRKARRDAYELLDVARARGIITEDQDREATLRYREVYEGLVERL